MNNIPGVAIDWVTVSSVTAVLVSFLKPLIEAIPGARPTDTTHDSAIRGASVLLSVVVILVLLISSGQMTAGNWYTLLPVLLSYALTGAAGAHLFYHVTTRSGSSVNLPAPAAPPLAKPIILPPEAPRSLERNDLVTPHG